MFDISGDLSTWACRHNRNGSDCFLSEMFTVTGLWLCFDLCCGRICFWIDGSSAFYYWQGIILVIIKISIRLEITLRLAGPDVFFLPQTCLTCFRNLIYLSSCNHLFEDIFTVMNEGNVHSLCHQQTYLTDILIDLQISGLPERESKPLITSHWMFFCGSFKFCSATIKKLNNTTQRKL